MVDAGWIIYVVDLESINQTYYDLMDTATDKVSIGLKIEDGRGGKDTDYIDLAYFAIVDNFDEVKTLLDGETANFEFVSVWTNESLDATRTSQNVCIDHALSNIDSNKVSLGATDADICFTCDRAIGCANPECTDYSATESVYTEVGHNIRVTVGNPTYKGGSDDKVCYTVTETSTCAVCGYTSTKTANGAHNMVLNNVAEVEGGVKYTYKCSVEGCGNIQSVTVASEGVNYVSAPGQQINNWATGTSESNKQANKVETGAILADESGVYVRIHLYQGGNFATSNGTGEMPEALANPDDKIEGGAGRYAVFKMRTNDLDYVSFAAYDAQRPVGNTDNLLHGNGRKEFAEGWVIYVVDLQAFANSWYQVGAEITNATFGFQGETGKDTLSGNEFIDLAYFAICDNWTEIGQITGTDASVVYTDWKTPANDTQKTVSEQIALEAQQ